MKCNDCKGCRASKCKTCAPCLNPQMKKPCVDQQCLFPLPPKCPCFAKKYETKEAERASLGNSSVHANDNDPDDAKEKNGNQASQSMSSDNAYYMRYSLKNLNHQKLTLKKTRNQ